MVISDVWARNWRLVVVSLAEKSFNWLKEENTSLSNTMTKEDSIEVKLTKICHKSL